MSYQVLWDSWALLDLKRIDKQVAVRLVAKVSSYLVEDPLYIGKPLTGQLKGLMRYRFGDYRVIYQTDVDKQMIIVVRVGHRSAVY